MPNGVLDVDVSWEPSTYWYTETFGNTAYDDVSANVKSISIRRGRSTDMGQQMQGSCTIRLNDPAGLYNPKNAAGSLFGYLMPFRPIRVRAVYATVTYPLFYGYISRIEHDPSKGVKESIIEAVDLSTVLTQISPNISSMPGNPVYTNQTVGYLLHELLDTTGIDAAVWGDFDDGATIPSFAPDGTATILSLIGDLIKVDQGSVFVAADGKLTYRDVDTLYAAQAAVATFDETMATGLRASISGDGVVNEQSVTRTGGSAQTASYPAPPGQSFFPRPGTAITSGYLATDAQAKNLATLIVYTQGFPKSPARQIRLVNGDATRLVQQLSRELADFVTVDEANGGTSFSGWIASIEHEISSNGLVHVTKFAVQERPLTFLVLNGGFETAGAGAPDYFANWTEAANGGTITRSTGANEYNGGVAGCKLSADASLDTMVTQQFTVTPEATCLLVFASRAFSTYPGRYRVYDDTHAADIIALTSTGVTGTTWTYVEASFTVPAGCTTITLTLACPATDLRAAYFDDVQIYELA